MTGPEHRATSRGEPADRSESGHEALDGGAAEREAAERAAEVTRRAIRRLDVLEWLGYAVAAIVAILGGAVVAWMVAEPAGWDFRTTWIGSAFVLLVVPGVIVFRNMRQSERGDS